MFIYFQTILINSLLNAQEEQTCWGQASSITLLFPGHGTTIAQVEATEASPANIAELLGTSKTRPCKIGDRPWPMEVAFESQFVFHTVGLSKVKQWLSTEVGSRIQRVTLDFTPGSMVVKVTAGMRLYIDLDEMREKLRKIENPPIVTKVL